MIKHRAGGVGGAAACHDVRDRRQHGPLGPVRPVHHSGSRRSRFDRRRHVRRAHHVHAVVIGGAAVRRRERVDVANDVDAHVTNRCRQRHGAVASKSAVSLRGPAWAARIDALQRADHNRVGYVAPVQHQIDRPSGRVQQIVNASVSRISVINRGPLGQAGPVITRTGNRGHAWRDNAHHQHFGP